MKHFLFLSLIVILAVQTAALMYSWYNSVWWLDIPMHVIGGMWAGLLFFYIFDERWQRWRVGREALWMTLILALGFTALVGVLWEFQEYILDIFVVQQYGIFDPQSGRLPDTLADLFNDLFGGFVAALSYYGLQRRNSATTGR